MDTEGTVLVRIGLRSEVVRVLELAQLITGEGMGKLIEGAVMESLGVWRRLGALAVREGEAELAADAMELEALGVKLVRLGSVRRPRGRRRVKTASAG